MFWQVNWGKEQKNKRKAGGVLVGPKVLEKKKREWGDYGGGWEMINSESCRNERIGSTLNMEEKRNRG